MTYTVTANNGGIRLNETELVRSVLQNVAIILATRKGSVPLYREFGLSMKFLDMPLSAGRALTIADINEAVSKFEPRARVVDVSFDYDQNDVGKIFPKVEVEILA